jgi:metal-dependent hydrolase (beta-lactamase superfamily II)
VEHEGVRILFDTGNDSELFRHSVETLDIDLKRLDFVVISHGTAITPMDCGICFASTRR